MYLQSTIQRFHVMYFKYCYHFVKLSELSHPSDNSTIYFKCCHHFLQVIIRRSWIGVFNGFIPTPLYISSVFYHMFNHQNYFLQVIIRRSWLGVLRNYVAELLDVVSFFHLTIRRYDTHPRSNLTTYIHTHTHIHTYIHTYTHTG